MILSRLTSIPGLDNWKRMCAPVHWMLELNLEISKLDRVLSARELPLRHTRDPRRQSVDTMHLEKVEILN